MIYYEPNGNIWQTKTYDNGAVVSWLESWFDKRNQLRRYDVAAVHLGMKSKLQILARHAMNLSRRIFGIPDFRFYALADGIRELLMKAGKGISTYLSQDHPDPQSDLFAT